MFSLSSKVIARVPLRARHLTSGVPSGKSFKILGIQQIAIGALSKSVLSEFWTGKLGIPKVSEYKSEVHCHVKFFGLKMYFELSLTYLFLP
jgi:hypothetical protein